MCSSEGSVKRIKLALWDWEPENFERSGGSIYKDAVQSFHRAYHRLQLAHASKILCCINGIMVCAISSLVSGDNMRPSVFWNKSSAAKLVMANFKLCV